MVVVVVVIDADRWPVVVAAPPAALAPAALAALAVTTDVDAGGSNIAMSSEDARPEEAMGADAWVGRVN